MSYYDIDFDRHPMPRSEDYVSPYLRRPIRTLEQAMQAVRGGPLRKTDISRSPCREGLPASGAALGQGETAPARISAVPGRRSE